MNCNNTIMRKLFIYILALIVTPPIAMGYSILPDAIKSNKHFVKTTRELTLAPSPTIKAFIIKNASITKNNITLEANHTFKKPHFMKNPISDNDRLTIINILHSVSSMQGIQYYSTTKKNCALFLKNRM